MKKLLLCLVAILMLCSLLAACADTGSREAQDPGTATDESTGDTATNEDTGEAEGDVQNILIGYSISAMSENMQRSVDGIQARIDEINASDSGIHVEMVYTDAQNNVDKQFADVEAMIAQGPDLIILDSVDAVGAIPAAQAIREAGIFCMESRGMALEEVDLSYMGTDDVAVSQMTADYLREMLEADPDLTFTATLMYGNPAQTNNLRRLDKVKELAEEMGDRFTIIDERFGNWSTDEAMAITENWLQVYGDQINLICSASDDMALGITNALAAAGVMDDVLVTSVDGTKIGEELVSNGRVGMCVKMLMGERGRDQLDIALACLSGEFTDNFYTPGAKILVPMTLENFDELSQMN